MMKSFPFAAAVGAWLLAFTASVAAQMSEEATVENAAGDELLWLAIVTMLIVIGIGVWQVMKTRKAKRTNEHSAMTEHDPKARSDRDVR